LFSTTKNDEKINSAFPEKRRNIALVFSPEKV